MPGSRLSNLGNFEFHKFTQKSVVIIYWTPPPPPMERNYPLGQSLETKMNPRLKDKRHFRHKRGLQDVKNLKVSRISIGRTYLKISPLMKHTVNISSRLCRNQLLSVHGQAQKSKNNSYSLKRSILNNILLKY